MSRPALRALALLCLFSLPAHGAPVVTGDLFQPDRWEFLSDRVMGGVSTGQMTLDREGDTRFVRLTGEVSTENRGGFLQMRVPLDTPLPADAKGLTVTLRGNGERYYVHLRTSRTRLPWQFHQAGIESSKDWTELRLPFADFVPKGGFLRARIDPETIESIGVAAYGRPHSADVSVAAIGYYR